MSAGTGSLRGLAGFGAGFSARVCRRALGGRWRRLRPGKFLPFLQPGLILRRIVHDERPFHAVMTEAAKLATDHFVTAGLDRLEPHWDDLAGNRVLRYA